MIFFSKHFIILLYKTYNKSFVNIFVKKKFIIYSVIRKFLKKKIYKIFKKINYFFYGYKILFLLNFPYDINRYYKFLKFNFNFLFEIFFFFKKIFLFINFFFKK
ncbi:hypothetical protein CA212_183 [Candidatus Nasuia deltocephalinicola]|nr:hypothetical protein CA212_183 [Candidatus Nasuia deltocephalinicola]